MKKSHEKEVRGLRQEIRSSRLEASRMAEALDSLRDECDEMKAQLSGCEKQVGPVVALCPVSSLKTVG